MMKHLALLLAVLASSCSALEGGRIRVTPDGALKLSVVAEDVDGLKHQLEATIREGELQSAKIDELSAESEELADEVDGSVSLEEGIAGTGLTGLATYIAISWLRDRKYVNRVQAASPTEAGGTP